MKIGDRVRLSEFGKEAFSIGYGKGRRVSGVIFGRALRFPPGEGWRVKWGPGQKKTPDVLRSWFLSVIEEGSKFNIEDFTSKWNRNRLTMDRDEYEEYLRDLDAVIDGATYAHVDPEIEALKEALRAGGLS